MVSRELLSIQVSQDISIPWRDKEVIQLLDSIPLKQEKKKKLIGKTVIGISDFFNSLAPFLLLEQSIKCWEIGK